MVSAEAATKNQFKIELSEKEFRMLRTNPKFILVLQLARYVNQINYLWSTLDTEEGKSFESSFLTRQTFNRMLFTAGVMYEMLQIAPSLGKEFRTYPSYKNGFQKLLKDRNTQILKAGLLYKMRNNVVYHINRDPIEQTLKDLEMPEYIFLRSDSDKWQDEYFQLADDVTMNFITGKFDDDDEQVKALREQAERLGRLVIDFNKSAHALILEYAQRKDWKLSGRPPKI